MTPVDDSINITTATEILRRTPEEEKIFPEEKYEPEVDDLEEDSFAEFLIQKKRKI